MENELKRSLNSVVRAEKECDVYCPSCPKLLHVQPGDVIPKHMECITSKLQEMGARITNYDDAIRIQVDKRLRYTTVKTRPYPGFPTDIQAQICVCMSLAIGVS